MGLSVSLNIFGEKTREPGECIVLMGVAEEEIVDFYPLLMELTIDASRSEAAVAKLIFEGRRDEQGKWIVQDSGIFKDWEPIKIKVAFGDKEEEIMRGYVRSSKLEYPTDAGSAKVTIECQDDSYRLDRTHRNKTWGEDTPSSDAQILQEIVLPYGLTLSGDNGAGQSGIEVNQNGSDIAFLKSRATENGYELIFSQGEVYFGPMQLEAEAQPNIMAYAGRETNCISINVSTDSHQPDAVAFDVPDETGDGSTETLVEPDLFVMGPEHASSADSGLEDFIWKMSGETGSDAAALTEKAQQKANEFDIKKVNATGELDGMLYGNVLRPGFPVGVDGIGERYNGTYYVDKVVHKFTYEGYRQNFTLLRNAYGDNLESAGGLLAGIL
ncbi:hypothetical protein [Thalassomonas sp. RHCl1]|uniref:phage late control D family protein n=1 Tax=Thalassomonas sp. RHCl1 TaxID=2995320 RepID=UPI00248B1400|nr:hypothetical protein [Thalassomonas sp. RHCl1]